MLNKEIWDKVLALDLQEVRKKYLQGKSLWWRIKRWFSSKDENRFVEEVESHYRQFLYLAGTSTDTIIPWTQDVDDFWHIHILNTAKYTEDCMNLFGRFINHNPNVPQGTSRHQRAFKTTKTRYRETFVPTRANSHYCQTDDSSNSFIPYLMFWDMSTRQHEYSRLWDVDAESPSHPSPLRDEVCPTPVDHTGAGGHPLDHQPSTPVEYSAPETHHHDSGSYDGGSHHDSGSSYDGGSYDSGGSSGCGSSGCSSGGGD